MGEIAVKWKPSAGKDIERILQYIAIERQNPATGIKYISGLIRFYEELNKFGISIRNSR